MNLQRRQLTEHPAVLARVVVVRDLGLLVVLLDGHRLEGLDEGLERQLLHWKHADHALVSKRLLDRRDHTLVLLLPLELGEHHEQNEEAQQQRHHVAEGDDPLGHARSVLLGSALAHAQAAAPSGALSEITL